MGVDLGSAYGHVDIDTSKVSSSMATAKKDVQAFSKTCEKVGDSLTNVGTKMTAGITAPIVGLGVLAFDAASDLNESMSKVGVVFDDVAGRVTAWSETSDTALGMTQQRALEAAGTFGNLFTSMGMAEGSAADMSTGIVQLAADLASFNNIGSAEALEKLRAGLVGEAEPLRTLGVNLTEAATKAKAMAMGLASTEDELTPAMLMQARYAIILEQTKNAQGDFARTSDGAANSLRIAQAQIGNAAASLGTILLPIVTQVIQKVSELIGRFQSLSTGTKTTILVVAGIAAVAGPVLVAIGSIVGAVGTLSAAFSAVGAAVGIGLGPVLLIIAAVAAAVALLYLAWTNNWGGIQEKVAAVWAALQPAFAAIQQWLAVNIPAAIAALSAFWSNTLLPAIQAVWSFIQAYLVPIFSLVAQVIGQLARIELMLLQAAWENLILPALQKVWGFLQENVLPVFQTLAGFIATVIEKAIALEQKLGLVRKAFDLIADALQRVIDFLRSLVEGLKNVKVPKWLEGKSPPPMANWLGSIAEQAQAATSALAEMGASTSGMSGLRVGRATGAGAAGATVVQMAGDTNNYYVSNQGLAALVSAMVDERRAARLNAFMGVA